MSEYLNGAWDKPGKFRSAVKSTVKSEKNIRDKYQAYGLHALAHCKRHGDTVYLGILVNEMSTQSPYRKTMIKWIKTYAPVKLDGNEGNLRWVKKSKASDLAQTDVVAAAAKNFWNIDEENPGAAFFDYKAILKKMLEQQEKLEESDDPKKDYRIMTKTDKAAVEQLLARADKNQVVKKDGKNSEETVAA